MSTLGVSFPPVERVTYPHMMPEDHQVWSDFLREYGSQIKEVWYDVHVGAPIPTAPGAPDYLRKVAAGIGQKRIDVVAGFDWGFMVIEVKPTGSMQALGQVLCYVELFVQDFAPRGEIKPVVVCNLMDQDLVPIFTARQVGVIEMKRD